MLNSKQVVKTRRPADTLVLRDVQGEDHIILLVQIVDTWYPNTMNVAQKLQHFLSQIWQFVSVIRPPRAAGRAGRFRRFLARC